MCVSTVCVLCMFVLQKSPCFNDVCFVQFTALPLNTVVQPQAQASFEYSFIPAQPMAGRPFGLVILLNYLDAEVKRVFHYL